jgi:nitric-oxide synthase, bacterial
MSTEISGRNLTDPYRYDYKQMIAKDLGLNTDSNMSLWFEKVQTVLNEAVLYSYNRAKVSITDQYSASESFMHHYKKEIKERGYCPADWIWLVPPIAGGMSELFHQEMVNFFVAPAYKTRRFSL